MGYVTKTIRRSRSWLRSLMIRRATWRWRSEGGCGAAGLFRPTEGARRPPPAASSSQSLRMAPPSHQRRTRSGRLPRGPEAIRVSRAGIAAFYGAQRRSGIWNAHDLMESEGIPASRYLVAAIFSRPVLPHGAVLDRVVRQGFDRPCFVRNMRSVLSGIDDAIGHARVFALSCLDASDGHGSPPSK
jgi:hypothetical protein